MDNYWVPIDDGWNHRSIAHTIASTSVLRAYRMWWITIDCLSTMDETIEVQTVWRIIYWSNYTSKKCFATIIIINWFIFIFSLLYWTPAHILVYLVHSIHLYYWRLQIFVRSILRVAQCNAVVFFINNYWIFYHVDKYPLYNCKRSRHPSCTYQYRRWSMHKNTQV